MLPETYSLCWYDKTLAKSFEDADEKGFLLGYPVDNPDEGGFVLKEFGMYAGPIGDMMDVITMTAKHYDKYGESNLRFGLCKNKKIIYVDGE